MGLWGKNALANNAPKFPVISNANKVNTAVYGNTAFVNSTASAFVNNAVIGVFGANTATANSVGRGTTPGWVIKTQGTGPVANLTVNTAGASYTNGDIVRVSNGAVNATFTVSTNTGGSITSLTSTNNGAGFINVATAVVAVTNSSGGTTTGSSATFVLRLGGRAGRVNYETLVAMKTIAGANTALT
ncbi:hypothetical protein [Caulobacter phage Cr30]|uniref:hypothetical protein n=1 Tax=Caulobacter phage Cr30 TaxID=1357714 RepID=UPI0004A9BA07|nr:hypothetical protein OZ74_gp063 [Caulobacter phage Cr30]AGS80948.1 hypothetical protein [Caulobacter phage Cr30]